MIVSKLISKTQQVSESKRLLNTMEPIDERPSEGHTQATEPHGKVSADFSHDSPQSLLRSLTNEYSKINYISSRCLSTLASSAMNGQARDSTIPPSIESDSEKDLLEKSEEKLIEEFHAHVSKIMNEDNYWGCFYNLPELYADVYSPVVRIRNLEDVEELVDGELTKDMVSTCLTYLKRTPILGDLVYIKLDLSSKHLQNIDVLAQYKFLVYLDLSSNFLTDLTVLKNLLYLQFLSVAFNRLSTVLDYETPQWFLTEVHYKYNSVKRIRDLTLFWSLTVLDLSHNNIKCITGLENLKFLRRLDLSFNHIQRLENLNHLRLTWLDISYNNISGFEFSTDTGLWTLLHLEYLNLNENNITTMRMFSYCTRLRQLYLRNNRLSVMLEVPVYLCQMRRLVVLDLRANPICSGPAYKTVIVNTLLSLLNLDAEDLDPVEQRTLLMNMNPDVTMHTTRKLLRLIYIEQLSKARVSPFVPPADTTDVPIVVLVGQEGVGKGTLARRLATECHSHIQLALQHTTAKFHCQNHYKEISMKNFDDMLLKGDFLTYSEMDGESYGLSREEAFVTDGKVKVACLDLPAALMLKLRGYRPYLILTSYFDKVNLKKIQEFRKTQRVLFNRDRFSRESSSEQHTLQVMFSGRIIITGIINEIILSLAEEKRQSEFVLESECSLMMESETRQTRRDHAARSFNILSLLNPSCESLEGTKRQSQEMEERSLYSLFKGSQITSDYVSDISPHLHNQEHNHKKSMRINSTPVLRSSLGCETLCCTEFSAMCPSRVATQESSQHAWEKDKRQSRSKFTDKHSNLSQPMHSHPAGYTSSKSVTFTSESGDPSTMGMMIEPIKETEAQMSRTISTQPWPLLGWQTRLGSHVSIDESDLWLAFLTEAGYLAQSDTNALMEDSNVTQRTTAMEYDVLCPTMESSTSYSPNMGLRDPYEHIHHHSPGLFWDTVTMDDPETAFINVRRIIRNIVNSQKKLRPMFDIDFAHLRDYPTVEKKVVKIRKQIAAQQLFY